MHLVLFSFWHVSHKGGKMIGLVVWPVPHELAFTMCVLRACASAVRVALPAVVFGFYVGNAYGRRFF